MAPMKGEHNKMSISPQCGRRKTTSHLLRSEPTVVRTCSELRDHHQSKSSLSIASRPRTPSSLIRSKKLIGWRFMGACIPTNAKLRRHAERQCLVAGKLRRILDIRHNTWLQSFQLLRKLIPHPFLRLGTFSTSDESRRSCPKSAYQLPRYCRS